MLARAHEGGRRRCLSPLWKLGNHHTHHTTHPHTIRPLLSHLSFVFAVCCSIMEPVQGSSWVDAVPAPIRPALWPVLNIIDICSRPSDEKADEPKATSDLDLESHLGAMVAASRSFLLAVFCIYGLYDGDNYPAFGRAQTWSLSWMLPIVLRNLVATWLICGFWDWFLYFSPLKDKLHKFKFNQTFPSTAQLKHDAFWTTLASVIAALLEIVLCHFWATGTFPMYKTLSEAPLYHALWAVTITHWRIPHFYLIHRGMHPWKTDTIPDVGKWLYKHVHSLHHKSYNPTAFSGTNMHPVEALLYYSASLIAIPFGCHPAIALGCIIDCGVGAWLGHDGFQWPGSGDYFHQNHHAHFDCNYGAQHVPIDKWVGTYAASRSDVRAIWHKGAKN
eukprot:m.477535 g.477535  ORF g.477535 m.477535 type:complete len:389 (-) comp20856_c0_seq1:247-1413(-)